MTEIARLRRLFEYDAWANRQALRAVEEAGAADERVRRLLAHILVAQKAWRARIDGVALVVADFFPVWSADELAEAIEEAAADWARRFDALAEPDLGRIMAYRTSTGEDFESALGDVLTHVANHGTYHRGQLAAAVRQAGGKPPATDFIVFARGR